MTNGGGWHWFFLWPLIPLLWFFLIFLCFRFFFWRSPWRRSWYGYHAAHDPKTILPNATPAAKSTTTNTENASTTSSSNQGQSHERPLEFAPARYSAADPQRRSCCHTAGGWRSHLRGGDGTDPRPHTRLRLPG